MRKFVYGKEVMKLLSTCKVKNQFNVPEDLIDFFHEKLLLGVDAGQGLMKGVLKSVGDEPIGNFKKRELNKSLLGHHYPFTKLSVNRSDEYPIKFYSQGYFFRTSQIEKLCKDIEADFEAVFYGHSRTLNSWVMCVFGKKEGDFFLQEDVGEFSLNH